MAMLTSIYANTFLQRSRFSRNPMTPSPLPKCESFSKLPWRIAAFKVYKHTAVISAQLANFSHPVSWPSSTKYNSRLRSFLKVVPIRCATSKGENVATPPTADSFDFTVSPCHCITSKTVGLLPSKRRVP